MNKLLLMSLATVAGVLQLHAFTPTACPSNLAGTDKGQQFCVKQFEHDLQYSSQYKKLSQAQKDALSHNLVCAKRAKSRGGTCMFACNRSTDCATYAELTGSGLVQCNKDPGSSYTGKVCTVKQ